MSKLKFKSKKELVEHKKNIISSIAERQHDYKKNYADSIAIFGFLIINFIAIFFTTLYIFTSYTPTPATFMLNKDNTLVSIPSSDLPNKCPSDVRFFLSSFVSDIYNFTFQDRQTVINLSLDKYSNPTVKENFRTIFLAERSATNILKSTQGRSGWSFNRNLPSIIQEGVLQVGNLPTYYWMLEFGGQQVIYTPSGNQSLLQRTQSCIAIVMRDDIAKFEDGISVLKFQCFRSTTDAGKKISSLRKQLKDNIISNPNNLKCNSL
jgi:hypothetical protein